MGASSSESRAPYLGLSAFGEDDADRFFGRRAERDLVVANLLTSRLTVLYGPSGVGQSSLLRAGVLPHLRSGAGLPSGGSRREVVLVDAWQRDPVQAILRAVGTAPADDVPLDDALADHARRGGGILLFVLDQFEEYFLYHGNDGDRLRVELPRALARNDVRARVLIAVREDALATLDRLEGSAQFVNLLRLGPMSDEAAVEAMARPAELDGTLTLEPGLPEQVLHLLHGPEPRARAQTTAVGVEPVYLQLVMRRLWELERRHGSSVLRLATLASMGGLRDIVGEHLGEAMGRLTPRERARMADAFRFLVTPSGAKIAQRRDDLAELTGTEERELAAPLEKLAAADARILRPVDDVPSYELFHDVLAQPLLDWRARFHADRLRRRATALAALSAAAAAIVLALVAFILKPTWLQDAELRTIDARFALKGTTPVEPGIVIVDLDEASLAALGGAGARIPRDVHARMIDTLREAGALGIAYDFEFREATPADARLRAAIGRAGPRLLLAAVRIDSNGQGLVLGGPGRRLPAGVGYAGFPLSADRAYRQFDESVGLPGASARRLRSFAVVAAGLAGDAPGRFRRAWIDFHGPARTFPTYRFTDVLRHADTSRLEGKLVVVGSSARRQRDLHPTEHGGGGVMSGAEIQANAISTLQRGRPLRSFGTPLALVIVVALGLLPALAAIVLRPRLAAVAVALAAVAYAVLAQLLFSVGWIVPVVIPLLCLLVSAAAVLALAQRRAA
jgi:CHASE2 domain-containing sensor protein